ncbi:MAG: tRNA (adenosine(37)-N6)-threonylcarbamoyltransferase complex transferase subunit TsaD [Candidatus Magasanikbacteria bacterium]
MRILGIESSCDDTSVALLDCSPKGCFVIREVAASQIEIHKKYGGVVPEIAGRLHAEKIVPLIEEVLQDQPRPDVIAVTAGPGLITGLIVGVEAARALSYIWKIPLVAVNHIEGHILSCEISNYKFKILNTNSKLQIENQADRQTDQSQDSLTPNTLHLPPKIIYPALALIVSGGHTELIFIKKPGRYKIIGRTRDDAAGECFDKVAKLLDLPYPGGPQISRLAQTGRTDAIAFPRPMLKEKNYDFSFSGLKTSTLYWLQKNPICHPFDRLRAGSERNEGSFPKIQQNKDSSAPLRSAQNDICIPDFCASFEQAIVDVLVAKTMSAASELKPKSIILAGGVSANKKLRATLADQITRSLPNTFYLTPNTSYSMDNAAMIAVAGYYHALKKDFTPWKKIQADPNLEL